MPVSSILGMEALQPSDRTAIGDQAGLIPRTGSWWREYYFHPANAALTALYLGWGEEGRIVQGS